MKQKILVEPHESPDTLVQNLFVLVGWHNKGNQCLTPEILESFVLAFSSRTNKSLTLYIVSEDVFTIKDYEKPICTFYYRNIIGNFPPNPARVFHEKEVDDIIERQDFIKKQQEINLNGLGNRLKSKGGENV